MDRISALRNVERALAEFEEGEADLASVEERVLTVLRTYATDFDAETDLTAYRARGDDRVAGMVVVAESPREARERVRDLLDEETLAVEVTPVERSGTGGRGT